VSKVGTNIKKLRKAKKISRYKLSKLAGLAHKSIVKLETGQISSPRIVTLQKIAKALGVSVYRLIP
jgi:transcriptional regulator with XRE-family HTH domain